MSQNVSGQVTHDPGIKGGRHYLGIDGLRAVAVIAVLWFHTSESRGGFLGVDVFFAISGFVITLTLLRERERTGEVRIGRFYQRRFWRLTPAMLLMLVLAAAIELPTGAVRGSVFGREVLEALTYTYNLFNAGQPSEPHGLNHAWSLATEEQFYLVWAPAFALVVALRRRVPVMIGAAVVLFGASLWIAQTWSIWASYMLPFGRFAEILVGATLAVILHHKRRGRIGMLLRSRVVAAGALLALLAEMVAITTTYGRSGAFGGYLLAALLAGVLIGHCYAIAASRTATSPIAAGLAWAPLVWIGQRSYGIYLFHYPIVVALRQHSAGTLANAVLIVGGSVALAALSYRYVETPLRRYGTRSSRAERPAAPVDARA